jgi:hypothetical protein
MTSLKALIPELAKALELTPAVIYERQRALVRAGLLDAKPGHGPGSGVRATPESLAMLLIAILAPGGLSETAAQSKAIAKLKSDTGQCAVTGKNSFAAALVAVLADENLANGVDRISADQNGAKFAAKFFYWQKPSNPGQPVVSNFGSSAFKTLAPRIISATLVLPHLGRIADKLR